MTVSAFMRRALALAEELRGRTSPNPCVGCVIVKDGVVIAEAIYRGEATPHAEVAALQVAGERARGATAYVTLEPCAHAISSSTGQPRYACSRALIEAGVARVVVALVDPDPRTSGKGIETLQAAGIEVEIGDGAEEAARQLEAYLKHRLTGLPFVTVKYATTMDGRIAAASGDSRWVSGPETLRWAHEGRSRLDAILVGSETVVVDNPQLTARPEGRAAEQQPLRIVLDSRGRISPSAGVLRGDSKTLVVTTSASADVWRDQIVAAGAELLLVEAGADGHVALLPVLEELGKRGVLNLLVEGGGVVIGSFFDQRLVDKVTAVIALKIVGAANAAGPVAGKGAYRMADAVRLRDTSVERLGDDVLITGYPIWPEESG